MTPPPDGNWPLRLPAATPDRAGMTCRLTWLLPDGALVLKGEPLCEAVPEAAPPGGTEPLLLQSPAPGQLSRLAAAAGGLPPGTLVGELSSGADLERQLRPRAAAALTALRAPRTPAADRQTAARFAGLTRQLLALEADVTRLRRRFPAAEPPAAGGLSLPDGAAIRTAAALRDALADPAQPEPRPGGSLPAADCRILCEVLRALTETGTAPRGEAAGWLATLSALERLYDARIREYREAGADLPPELLEGTLRLWQDLKHERLRVLETR
jgi:hypothetical protein